MMSTIGFLIVAALLLYGIYKGIIALFSIFPDSAFRTFLLSPSGKVIIGFISPIILYILFVYFMINFSGIHC